MSEEKRNLPGKLGLATTGAFKICASTTTIADKRMGKVVGEPYRGKPDVRFDEGTKGRKVWKSD